MSDIGSGTNAPRELWEASRQLRNNNDDGFVVAYDCKIINRVFAKKAEEIAELKEEIKNLTIKLPIEFDYRKCSKNKGGDDILFSGEDSDGDLYYVYKSEDGNHNHMYTDSLGCNTVGESDIFDLVMDEEPKDNTEDWENGKLGRDERYVELVELGEEGLKLIEEISNYLSASNLGAISVTGGFHKKMELITKRKEGINNEK